MSVKCSVLRRCPSIAIVHVYCVLYCIVYCLLRFSTLHYCPFIVQSVSAHLSLDSTLYTVHSIMYNSHCMQYSVHFTLYTVHCSAVRHRQPDSEPCWALHNLKGFVTVYPVWCSLYVVHCTLSDVQCTLYPVWCTVYTVHCILYTLHFTMLTTHCTLYTIHSFNIIVYILTL